MKKCNKCHQDKLLSDYNEKKNSRDGLCGSCKDCRKKYHLEWYHRTKVDPLRKEKHRKYQIVTRTRMISFVREYLLSHPCVDCGESDICVLDFDHVRGVKVANISDLVRDGSKELLLNEIEKCEVRCANDHRRVTAKRREKGFLTQ